MVPTAGTHAKSQNTVAPAVATWVAGTQIKRRSGLKQMTLPNGRSRKLGKLLRPWDVAATPLQLALARGYRWLTMLESGKVKNLKEITALEGVDNSYVSRMVYLTTLAADIVEAIL
jgi:hypothetical protein